MVLRVFSSRLQEQFHHPRVRLSDGGENGLGIEVNCDPRIGVTQGRLCDFDIHSQRPQVRSRGVPECMPAYPVAFDAGLVRGRADDLFQDHMRPDRKFAFRPDRGKQEVSRLRVRGDLLPLLQNFGNFRVQRDRLCAGCRLRFAELPSHARFVDGDL